MLTEVNTESLIFGADEDGTNDVAGHEQEEKPVVESRVVDGVEDG